MDGMGINYRNSFSHLPPPGCHATPGFVGRYPAAAGIFVDLAMPA